jgi:hypothetical protein
MKKLLLLFLISIITIFGAKAQWSEVNGLIVTSPENINFINNNKIWVTSDVNNNGNIIYEFDSLFNKTREINLSPFNLSTIRNVYSSNSDTVFLQAYFKYGNIFRFGLLATYDGGNTFTKDFFFNTADFSSVGVYVNFFNSQIGYFVKDSTNEPCLLTYQTYDAGKTWERRSGCDYLKYNYRTGKLSASVSEAMNYRKNGTVMTIFYNKNYDTNYIAYTYNYGATWHDRQLGPSKFDRITARNAARFILHNRESPIIAITTDSGITFQQFQRDELINSIRYYENNNEMGFYIMTTKNGTFVNFNEDNNWKKIDNVDFTFANFNSATNGYAAKDINNGVEYQIYNYASDGNVGILKAINKKTFLSIFPNPTNNKLNLVFEGNLPKNLIANIYDSKGSLIKSETLINNEIDINNLSQGLYLLTIESEGKRYCSKFIKE